MTAIPHKTAFTIAYKHVEFSTCNHKRPWSFPQFASQKARNRTNDSPVLQFRSKSPVDCQSHSLGGPSFPSRLFSFVLTTSNAIVRSFGDGPLDNPRSGASKHGKVSISQCIKAAFLDTLSGWPLSSPFPSWARNFARVIYV